METGTYEFDKSKKGRPRKIGRAIVNHVTWLAQEDPSVTVTQVQASLSEIDIHVHESTLRRTLQREGYTFKRLVKTARERSEYQPADFTLRMAEYSVEQLVFTDETHKDERDTVRGYGWGIRGQRAQAEAPFVRGKS